MCMLYALRKVDKQQNGHCLFAKHVETIGCSEHGCRAIIAHVEVHIDNNHCNLSVWRACISNAQSRTASTVLQCGHDFVELFVIAEVVTSQHYVSRDREVAGIYNCASCIDSLKLSSDDPLERERVSTQPCR